MKTKSKEVSSFSSCSTRTGTEFMELNRKCSDKSFKGLLYLEGVNSG